MDIDKLILDEEAIAKLGLGDKPIYLIEYDLHSEKKIKPDATKDQRKAIQERNKLARKMRNSLIYTIKYTLKATKHLESCWIIDESRLESAIDGLEALKIEMEQKGFNNVHKRLRIIPILTTEQGLENYEDKKAEFLLEFAMEHIRYMEKAKKAKRSANGLLWRCKSAFEVISEISGELKTHKRFKELIDTIEILDEANHRVEAMLKEQKDRKALAKAKLAKQAKK